MRTTTSATFADGGDSSLDEARDRQDTQASALQTAAKNRVVGFMAFGVYLQPV